MDNANTGKVDLTDIKVRFNAHKHPEVLLGKKAEDDVAYFEQLLVEAEASGNADEIARAQKRVDLMRDAITIYRLTRAPDQRIFMVDAGTIPTNQLQEAMELVKSGLKN